MFLVPEGGNIEILQEMWEWDKEKLKRDEK